MNLSVRHKGIFGTEEANQQQKLGDRKPFVCPSSVYDFNQNYNKQEKEILDLKLPEIFEERRAL